MHAIELVCVNPGRFDEIDVAMYVAKLGGSMNGRTATFPAERLDDAWRRLSKRFGESYFTISSPTMA